MTSGSPSSHVTAGFLNTDWNPAISRQAPPPATSCCAPPTAPPPPDRSTCPPAPARHRGVRDASARVHGLSLPDSRYRRGRLRGLVAGSPLGRQRPAAGARNRPAGRGRRPGPPARPGLQAHRPAGQFRGAGLYAFYAHQSGLPAAERSPARPAASSGLNELDMPHGRRHGADRPHPGQGALLLNCIDPSVADENDALSVTPELDPLAPATTSPAAAPATRRLSSSATASAAPARGATGRAGAADDRRAHAGARALKEQTEPSPELRRQAAHTPVMVVWRSDADLRCLDLSLDPSDRHPGSLWGKDPYASNYGAVGFARFCTPESWLSTWSGLSSNASLARTARASSSPR